MEFKEPIRDGKKVPYIVFNRPVKVTQNGTVIEMREDTVLEIVGSGRTKDSIHNYAMKPGWIVKKYWFPEEEDFAEARQTLEYLLGNSAKVQDLELEKEALQKKLAQYEAKERAK